MAKKTNPNAGKPGYDKYGVKLMSQRKKEEQAEKNRKQFIESRDARNKKIKDNAAQKAQVEKIKNTMGFSETSSSAPKSSTPKRKKQSVASSITDAKIKKLDTSIKGENIKAKKERSLSESDKQKLAKLEKMQNRADKKQSRKDKSIERLAFRMGDKATFQDAAALKQKRSEARKQYLRNFASQLARGEQAAPIRGFGEGEEGKPTTGNSLVDASGAKEEAKVKNEQAKQDEQSIQSSINTFKTPNSGLGLGLTPMGGVGQNFGEGVIRDLKIDMDSTPYDFMRKEYNKKRG
jgi:hypothetical protein